MAVHGTRNRDSVSWDYASVLRVLKNVARDHTGLPLLRCYWYEATVDGRRSAEHETVADLPGVKLRLGRMRPGHREGVESEIHRDLTTLARNRAISDALVVSAEEDLIQVITEVQDLGLRVILVHIGAPGWTASPVLRQECDDIVEIGDAHLRPSVDLVVGAEPVSEEERHAAYTSRAPANGHGPRGVIGQPQAMPAGSHTAPPAIYTGEVIAEYQRAAQPANSQPPAAADASGPLGTGRSPAGENGLARLAPGGPERDISGQPTLPQQAAPGGPPGMAPPPPAAGRPGPPPPRAAGSQPGLPHQAGLVGQPGAAVPPAAGSQPGLPSGLPHQAGSVGRPGLPPQAGPMSPTAVPGQSAVPGQPGLLGQPGQAGQAGVAGPSGMPDQAGLPGQAGLPPGLAGPPPVPGQHAVPGHHAGPGQQAMPPGQQAMAPGQLGLAPGQAGMPGQPGQGHAPVPLPQRAQPARGAGHHAGPLSPQAEPGPAVQGQHAQHKPLPQQYAPGQPAGAQPLPGQPAPGQAIPAYQAASPRPPSPGAPSAASAASAQPGFRGQAPEQAMPRLPTVGAPPGPGMGPPPGAVPPAPQIQQPLQSGQQVRGYQAEMPGRVPSGPADQRTRQFPVAPGQPDAGVTAPYVPQQGPHSEPQPAAQPALVPQPFAVSLADAVQAAHGEGFSFGQAVARDAPALWLEAVLARKPRMPSDLEARLLQDSSLPIDSLLHDEVRHALRRGFWDALERVRH